MASIVKEVVIDADPTRCWEAIRDFSALSERLVPGFVTQVEMVGPREREITFFTGVVAREYIVGADDERMRLAYTVTESPMGSSHHSASVQVIRGRFPLQSRVDHRRAPRRTRRTIRANDGRGHPGHQEHSRSDSLTTWCAWVGPHQQCPIGTGEAATISIATCLPRDCRRMGGKCRGIVDAAVMVTRLVAQPSHDLQARGIDKRLANLPQIIQECFDHLASPGVRRTTELRVHKVRRDR